jgi:hypothetical protein
MATTITVDRLTRAKLEELKHRKGARSFDELLSEMVDRELEIQNSLYGRVKGLRRAYVRDREERL